MQTLKEYLDEDKTWADVGGNWEIWKDEDYQNRYFISWLCTGVIFSYDYDENKSFKWLQNLMNADSRKKVESILEHRRKTNVEWHRLCA
jgi:hypothetical protein